MLGGVCFQAVLSIGSSTFITGGLRSCEGKLTHLEITAPSRSTLAYANEHRPWGLYQKVFLNLLDQCRNKFSGKKKFGFKNTLVSLDSSTIDLSLSLFGQQWLNITIATLSNVLKPCKENILYSTVTLLLPTFLRMNLNFYIVLSW